MTQNTKVLLCSICFSMLLNFKQNVYSQIYNQDTKIVVDMFNTDSKISNFSIKKNKGIQYIINNLNRRLYNVNINAAQSTQFSNQPAIFKLVSDIDISKIATLTSNSSTSETGNSGQQSIQENNINTEKSEVKTIDCFNRLYDSIKANDEKINIIKYNILKSKLTEALNSYKNQYYFLKQLNVHLQLLNDILLDGTRDYKTLIAEKISRTKGLLPNLLKSDSDKTLSLNLKIYTLQTFDSLDKLYDQITSNYTKTKEILARINQYNNNLTKNFSTTKPPKTEEVRKLNDDYINEKTQFDNITDIITDIKIVNNKVSDFEANGFVSTLVHTFDNINESNYVYITQNFVADEDEVKIKIDIQPKDATLTNNYAKFNGEYTGRTFGFKMNFSTGVFLIGDQNISDHSYRLDSIPGDANNNIIKQNRNKNAITPALGALMHFYYKTPHCFGIGGNFGLSINNQTHLNYHIGASLLFGEEQRIILSLGATVSQVQLISDQYSENQIVPKSLTSVPLQNFYNVGYYLSLTYNLSSN